MTCITSAKKLRIQAQITRFETMLDEAVAAYSGSIKNGVKSYAFEAGGGEASQKATKIDSKQLIDDIIKLQQWVDYYNRQLNGEGIINMKLRRDAQSIICSVV